MASNALDAQKWADFFQFLFIAVQHFNVIQMRRGVQKITLPGTIAEFVITT